MRKKKGACNCGCEGEYSMYVCMYVIGDRRCCLKKAKGIYRIRTKTVGKDNINTC